LANEVVARHRIILAFLEDLLEPEMNARIKRLRKSIRRAFARQYQVFLQRVVLKLFKDPEDAICLSINTMNPTPERVISSFLQGVVLFGQDQNGLVWRSFPERAIITPETAHISRRLKDVMKRNTFEIRSNSNFDEVLRACQRETWTWINDPLVDIYRKLFAMGYAHSIEAYRHGELVGGLWGLVIGRSYAIMSMFHRADHAGAVALGTLVSGLGKGEYSLVDCGEMNSNFARFGARNVSREAFTAKVVQGLVIAAASPCAHKEPEKRPTMRRPDAPMAVFPAIGG
jgi:leucyl/phenylalanyl-tRNA---protein transferase